MPGWHGGATTQIIVAMSSVSPARVVAIVLTSLRGIAGTVLGFGFITANAGDDGAWTGLVVGLGVICLVFGLVSLTQAAMVCTGRSRLMATAAIVEAGQLFLWLWALPLEEEPLVHLLLVTSIVGLCALAASMWRRAA